MRALLRILLPVLVIVAAILVVGALLKAKPRVEAKPQAQREVPVTVLRAQPSAHPTQLQALGEVKPVHRLVLQPEVSGRIVARSNSLLPGGLLRRGEQLVRIDARDHAAAVAQQNGGARAGAHDRGRRERPQGGRGVRLGRAAGQADEEARAFALREQHMRSAEATLSAARSQHARARRDLGKTSVKVPFDALVLDATVEMGQLVTPQASLATLVAIDRYWIEVAVPVAQLVHFEIPGVNVATDAKGSAARVLLDAGGGVVIEREGYIERLLGQVDARGRMARVLVAVDDPLGTAAAEARLKAEKAAPETARPRATLPLLLGSFVRVQIAGSPLADTTEVPRVALVDDHQVWLVEGGKLTAREVEVAWRTPDTVLVRGLRRARRW
jgi:multidrug efflux pump subunit AcrA (membrane-fusion protein)